jgi:hypothetical protein
MFEKLLTVSSVLILFSCVAGNEETSASFELDGMDVRNGFL